MGQVEITGFWNIQKNANNNFYLSHVSRIRKAITKMFSRGMHRLESMLDDNMDSEEVLYTYDDIKDTLLYFVIMEAEKDGNYEQQLSEINEHGSVNSWKEKIDTLNQKDLYVNEVNLTGANSESMILITNDADATLTLPSLEGIWALAMKGSQDSQNTLRQEIHLEINSIAQRQQIESAMAGLNNYEVGEINTAGFNRWMVYWAIEQWRSNQMVYTGPTGNLQQNLSAMLSEDDDWNTVLESFDSTICSWIRGVATIVKDGKEIIASAHFPGPDNNSKYITNDVRSGLISQVVAEHQQLHVFMGDLNCAGNLQVPNGWKEVLIDIPTENRWDRLYYKNSDLTKCIKIDGLKGNRAPIQPGDFISDHNGGMVGCVHKEEE